MFSSLLGKIARFISLVFGSHGILHLRPPRCEIVIFDGENFSLFMPLFDSNQRIELFDPQFKERIVFLPLVLALFDKIISMSNSSVTHHYFIRFLRLSRPKLIVTTEFYHADVFSAREAIRRFLDCRFLIIQRASPINLTALAGVLKPETLPLTKQDKVFALTSKYADEWKELCPQAEVITSGSIPGKILRLSEHHSCSKRVGYVSQWKSHNPVGSVPKYPKFYQIEEKWLGKLCDAVNKAGATFVVIGRSAESGEELFYRQILGDRLWQFSPKDSSSAGYTAVSSCSALVHAGSTLGIEAMTTGVKVLFLVDDSLKPESKALRFGDPETRYELWAKTLGSGRLESLTLSTLRSSKWPEQIDALLENENFHSIASRAVGEDAIDITITELKKVVCEMIAS